MPHAIEPTATTTVAVIAVSVSVIAFAAMLLADRWPPLRRVTGHAFPVLVSLAALTSLALLVIALRRGDPRLGFAAAIAALLLAVAASRRAAASQTRHRMLYRRFSEQARTRRRERRHPDQPNR